MLPLLFVSQNDSDFVIQGGFETKDLLCSKTVVDYVTLMPNLCLNPHGLYVEITCRLECPILS